MRGKIRSTPSAAPPWWASKFELPFFNSYRSEAPGWWQQPTASSKMENKLLRKLFRSFLDFTIGARNRSSAGALIYNGDLFLHWLVIVTSWPDYSFSAFISWVDTMTKKIFFEYSRHHRALFKKSFIFVYRTQVRVDEIFLHENFTTTDNKANDIALLRLGKNQHQTEFVLKNPLDNSFVPRGKGWSFHFPAGLLTCWGLQSRRRCWPCLWWGENFVVYGEETILFSMARRKFYLSDKSVCSDEANSSVLKSF